MPHPSRQCPLSHPILLSKKGMDSTTFKSQQLLCDTYLAFEKQRSSVLFIHNPCYSWPAPQSMWRAYLLPLCLIKRKKKSWAGWHKDVQDKSGQWCAHYSGKISLNNKDKISPKILSLWHRTPHLCSFLSWRAASVSQSQGFQLEVCLGVWAES